MDDLLPIGTFSERSGLSVKRLRTYAAAGVLVPAAVDPTTGYRYYSPNQLRRAHFIDLLRQAGMPLADIRASVSQPSRHELDAWADRLDAQATMRRDALEAARRLMASEEGLVLPVRPHQPEEAPMTTLRCAARTDKGPVREDNQDAVVTSDRLAVVADGMGGRPGGRVAATSLTGALDVAFTGGSPEELQAAVRAANWAIWDQAAKHRELKGMGTTVCAAGLLNDGHIVVVNVGDSRAYLCRDSTLTQLTRDHTLTAELVRSGELAADEASGHVHYGLLTRAVGVAPVVELDSATLDVDAGDRVLLCSDGLFNEVATSDISRVMATDGDSSAIVDELVTMAIANGGRDNVSVVVAEPIT